MEKEVNPFESFNKGDVVIYENIDIELDDDNMEERSEPYTVIKKIGGAHICPSTEYYYQYDRFFNSEFEIANNIRLADQSDVEWLEKCIKAGEFLTKDNSDLINDFVKYVIQDPETFGDFKLKSYEKKGDHYYGVAVDRLGMTYIYWNTEGHSCTYFGDKLERNIGVAIRKDGDTRYVFNGYCFNEDEFRIILKNTW